MKQEKNKEYERDFPMGDVLMKSIIKAATQHMNSSTVQLLEFLAYCADDTDDIDEEGVLRTKGGDIFPSKLDMSLSIGVSRNQANLIVKYLVSEQWIREQPGNKYLLYTRENSSKRRVKCYIINLAMLKRCLDAQETIKFMRENNAFYGMGELEMIRFVKELSKEAATFREGDWEDKSWTVSYTPRLLNVKPTIEEIKNIDWESKLDSNTEFRNNKLYLIDENGNAISTIRNGDNAQLDLVSANEVAVRNDNGKNSAMMMVFLTVLNWIIITAKKKSLL